MERVGGKSFQSTELSPDVVLSFVKPMLCSCNRISAHTYNFIGNYL